MLHIIPVLGFSILAGLGAFLGAVISLAYKPGRKALGAYLAFSAGLLLAVVTIILMPQAYESVGSPIGYLLISLSFLSGALFLLAIDRFFIYNPKKHATARDGRAREIGYSITFGILMDDLTEAVCIGLSFLVNWTAGVIFALIVFLQNIPETLSGSLELWKGGLSNKRILLMNGLVGTVAPVGAIISFTLFESLPPVPLACILAFSAGSVLYMVVAELIPQAEFEGGHEEAIAVALGFLVVLLSSQLGMTH